PGAARIAEYLLRLPGTGKSVPTPRTANYDCQLVHCHSAPQQTLDARESAVCAASILVAQDRSGCPIIVAGDSVWPSRRAGGWGTADACGSNCDSPPPAGGDLTLPWWLAVRTARAEADFGIGGPAWQDRIRAGRKGRGAVRAARRGGARGGGAAGVGGAGWRRAGHRQDPAGGCVCGPAGRGRVRLRMGELPGG